MRDGGLLSQALTFQSLVGAMRTGTRYDRSDPTQEVSIPRRGNEDVTAGPHELRDITMFQSLVGAMRTAQSYTLAYSHIAEFQSLVGAMRTPR